MNLVESSLQSFRQMFLEKTEEFINLTDNVHMLWLEEIEQEAKRMFSRDFNTEPELMPKTPSQKKNSRRRRVSVGRQEESQIRRRLSKGRRSNLNLIAEEEPVPEASTLAAQPKRATRATKQTKAVVQEVEEEEQMSQLPEGKKTCEDEAQHGAVMEVEPTASSAQSPSKIPSPEVVVQISSSERLSGEHALQLEACSTQTTDSLPAVAAVPLQRSSIRCSLKLRHSLAGLRHSMSQESVRRASRRSMLKRRVSRVANSMCSSNDEGCSIPVKEDCGEGVSEAAEPVDVIDSAAATATVATVQEEPKVLPQLLTGTVQEAVQSFGRVTRSVAANSPKLAPPSLFSVDKTPSRKIVVPEKQQSARKSRRSIKRKAPDVAEGSPNRFSPPKKSNSVLRPNMRSFLHTVQKNQMLMMTPSTLGRTGVIKSFIKHTTPLKFDAKTKERNKLEALKKKLEQEEERMKKMEEEKKKKQEELRRKREERLRRVNEAKVKEEQKEEQKKKKIEQKMAQIDEKNDKRLADEKAKKAAKRQEELEQKRKMEEEARKKKEEEERRQLELLAKMKAEEEEQQRLAEARRAQQERERLAAAAAAAERERLEREKALALKMEVERAAREKERKELEQRRRALEERQRLEEQQRLAAEEKAAREREAARQREAAAKQTNTILNQTVDIEGSMLGTPVGKGTMLNVTVDIEKSPQSYKITPKGGNKPIVVHSTENYGMDQNSDDSTDDESAPRKPIPSWAQGAKLQQIIMKQYFNPPDLNGFFGPIETPRLEKIFLKSKPRFFKRTSSAVWHEPMQ